MNACLADSGPVQVLRERRKRPRMRWERHHPMLARPRDPWLRRRSRCPPRADSVAHWIRYHELRFCLNHERRIFICRPSPSITTATSTVRISCTDNTGNRTDGTGCTGIPGDPVHGPVHGLPGPSLRKVTQPGSRDPPQRPGGALAWSPTAGDGHRMTPATTAPARRGKSAAWLTG